MTEVDEVYLKGMSHMAVLNGISEEDVIGAFEIYMLKNIEKENSMTVKELIEKLEKMNKESEVWVSSYGESIDYLCDVRAKEVIEEYGKALIF